MANLFTDSGKHQALKASAMRAGWSCLLVGTLLAAGCSSRSLTNAPVEDRGTGLARPAATAAANVKPPMPGAGWTHFDFSVSVKLDLERQFAQRGIVDDLRPAQHQGFRSGYVSHDLANAGVSRSRGSIRPHD